MNVNIVKDNIIKDDNRRIFYVDVDKMSLEEANKFLKHIRHEISTKPLEKDKS